MSMVALPTVIMLSFLSAFGSAIAQTSASIDVEIRDKLLEMGKSDQGVRAKVTPTISSFGLQSDQFKALAQEMDAIDQENYLELKRIVAQYGWPGMDRVGKDASNVAFLILQHSTLQQQKELLPRFRTAVANGQGRAADLAMLEDRIRVREGKKQIYGGSVSSGPDGHPRVDPIEDPANIDARRKSVGLPPIDEYLKRLEAEIGTAIDRGALVHE
jgi:hypothetical protein